MDEITLLVEGILNKIKKLNLLNKQLKTKILELERKGNALESLLAQEKERVDFLQDEILHTRMAGKLGRGETLGAKQKIDELLREIERLSVLLNK